MSAELSQRESEVWALLGTPMTYVEIGARLFISPRTVESHVESLRRKLGASNRRHLARMWVDREPETSLPAELSSFIGRERDIARTLDALSDSRLVTLTGPGGVGKTRLAVRAARKWRAESAGQCVYVDLVPLPTGADVGPAIAAACRAAPTGAVDAAIAARLSGAPALLILDNAEHVLDAAARLVETLLMRCPDLRVLVTSRARLVQPFERVVSLAGLGDGPTGAAVHLFRDRAGLPSIDGDRVASVCAALGGLPLAIELAAARLGTLELAGLEASLSRQLEALRGGSRANARHRSLRDTIEWSYNLLPTAERQLLTQLSIFAEPFTAASVDEVLDDRVTISLAILCEHSLLRLEPTDGEARYRMLEAVREFGRQQLGAERQAKLAARHARWALRAGSPTERLSAAEWCAGPGTDQALAHALWRALARDYFEAGRLRDAQAAYERDATLTTGLARGEALTDAAAVARCRVLGEDATRLDLQAANAMIEAGADAAAAEALARAADHAVRFAGMFATPPMQADVEETLSRAHHLAGTDTLANAALVVARAQSGARRGTGQVELARQALTHAEAAGDVRWIGGALDALSVALVESGQVTEAAELSLQRAQLIEEADDPRLALEAKDALHTGVLILTGAGRLAEARRLAERHLHLPSLRAEPDLACEELFAPAALSGDWDLALEHCNNYLATWQRAGKPVAPGRAIHPLAVALIHRLRGDDDEYARWHEAATTMRGDSPPGVYQSVFEAIALLDRGDPVGAVSALTDPRSGFLGRLFDAWMTALRFEAEILTGRAATAPVIDTNPIASLIVARAAALQADDRRAALATEHGFIHLGCPYQAARSRALASVDE